MAGKFHHEAIHRGDAVIAALSRLRIVICGVGALGSNLADTLARQGAARLCYIDRDRVEEHNIGTQIYTLADVGQFKAEALRKHLFRATGVEVESVRKELTAANARKLLKESDLVIDALDNAESREAVQRNARSDGAPTLHVGVVADYGEVIWDEAYQVPRNADGDVCDYPLARNLVTMTVAIAAETIVKWIATQQRNSWSITLGDMAVRPV